MNSPKTGSQKVYMLSSASQSSPPKSAGLPYKGSLDRKGAASTTKLYIPSTFLGVITGLSRVRSSLPCAL